MTGQYSCTKYVQTFRTILTRKIFSIFQKILDLSTGFSHIDDFTTVAASLSGVSVWISEVFAFAAGPGISVVTVSVWVESAADEKTVVSLIDGKWSVDGVLVGFGGGQQFWVDGWDGGDFWHFTSFTSVTVPVFVSVVVQWVDSGAGPQVFEELRDKGHLTVAQVFIAVVIVGNSAVTGEAHSSHVPSDVDVKVFSFRVANVWGWVVLTIQNSASVTSRQEVTRVVEFIQNWSRSSAQVWEVAPATITPDFGQSDWDVTFAWWAVIPNFSGVIVSSDSTVGQGVDNGLVDVLWDSVLLSLGGKSFDKGGFRLGGVVFEGHLLVEVDQFSFGKTSKLSNFSIDGGAGGKAHETSENQFHI